MDRVELMFIKIPALVRFNKEDPWISTYYMVAPNSIYHYSPYGYDIDGDQKTGVLVYSGGVGILSPLSMKEMYDKLKGTGFILKSDDLEEFK